MNRNQFVNSRALAALAVTGVTFSAATAYQGGAGNSPGGSPSQAREYRKARTQFPEIRYEK